MVSTLLRTFSPQIVLSIYFPIISSPLHVFYFNPSSAMKRRPPNPRKLADEAAVTTASSTFRYFSSMLHSFFNVYQVTAASLCFQSSIQSLSTWVMRLLKDSTYFCFERKPRQRISLTNVFHSINHFNMSLM